MVLRVVMSMEYYYVKCTVTWIALLFEEHNCIRGVLGVPLFVEYWCGFPLLVKDGDVHVVVYMKDSEFRLSLYEEHYSVKCMDIPGELLP
ncbi:hypothetical protein, conserved [Plasmodium vivax]|nr:hypothetical protein, conserved [Plasmodium vivax]